MVVEEQVYDPLSEAQKIVMLKNGSFEFEDIPNAKCLCGHSISEHLINLDGIADCCLYAKGNVCICERFQDEDSKVILPPKGKIPYLQKPVQPEEPRPNSYVHQLSQI